jgi:hypothetical protein
MQKPATSGVHKLTHRPFLSAVLSRSGFYEFTAEGKCSEFPETVHHGRESSVSSACVCRDWLWLSETRNETRPIVKLEEAASDFPADREPVMPTSQVQQSQRGEKLPLTLSG